LRGVSLPPTITVAATAHARSLPNNDRRLELERSAGELLAMAA